MMIRLFAAAAVACLSGPVFAQAGPGALFDRFDADGDGAVTYEEVQAWRTRFFTTADADENGFLTSEEMQAVRDQAAAAGAGGQRRGPRRGGRGGDPITRLDADGDGQLSRAEFVDAPFPALERFDRNEDGRLTRDELPGRPRG